VTNFWSAETRIGPLRFQAVCRRRRLNLSLVCRVYFMLLYISFDWWMCAFVVCVTFSFSIPIQEIGLGAFLKWLILCRVGRKTTIHSLACDWRHYAFGLSVCASNSGPEGIAFQQIISQAILNGIRSNVHDHCTLGCVNWLDFGVSGSKVQVTKYSEISSGACRWWHKYWRLSIEFYRVCLYLTLVWKSCTDAWVQIFVTARGRSGEPVMFTL